MAVLLPASPALLEETSNETEAWQEPKGLCHPQLHCWCLCVCTCMLCLLNDPRLLLN